MRSFLLILLFLIFIHAGTGSLLILAGLQELQSISLIRNLLTEIPQQNHGWNQLWLTATIGVGHLIPIHLNFKRHPARFRWVIACSSLLLLLIWIEVLILRHHYRFQLLLALEAVCTLLLAYSLEKEEEKTSSGAIIIRMKPRKRKNRYPTPLNPI